MGEHRLPAQVLDALGLEANPLQVVKRLFEAGRHQEGPFRRERAHVQLEACGGSKIVLEVRRGHGELVEISKQGGMAEWFGHG